MARLGALHAELAVSTPTHDHRHQGRRPSYMLVLPLLHRLGLQPEHQPGGWLARCIDLLFDELLLLDAEQLAHATAALCVFEVVLPPHALQQLHAAAESALDPDSGPGSTVGALTLARGVREAVGEALRRHLARLEELGASAAV